MMNQPTPPNQADQPAADPALAPEARQHDSNQLQQEMQAISALLDEEFEGLDHQWVMAG